MCACEHLFVTHAFDASVLAISRCIGRVNQNHTYIYIVLLAGILPYIRSYRVYKYGSGQPCA